MLSSGLNWNPPPEVPPYQTLKTRGAEPCKSSSLRIGYRVSEHSETARREAPLSPGDATCPALSVNPTLVKCCCLPLSHPSTWGTMRVFGDGR